MKTQIFIAAGGKGTRLGGITKSTPKSMVNVAGRPIISHLIDSATDADIDMIVVGVDEGKEMLCEYLLDEPVTIKKGCTEPLTSAFFASAQEMGADVVIGSNGDTIYRSEVIRHLLKQLTDNPDAGAAVLLTRIVRPIDSSTWTYWRHRFSDGRLVAMDEVAGHEIQAEYVLSAYRTSALREVSSDFTHSFTDITSAPFKVYSYGWDYLLRLLLEKGVKIVGSVTDDLSLNINHPRDIQEGEAFFFDPSLFRRNRLTAEGEGRPRQEEEALIVSRQGFDTTEAKRLLVAHGLRLMNEICTPDMSSVVLIVRGPGAFFGSRALSACLSTRGVEVEVISSESSFERAMTARLQSLGIQL